MNGKQLSRAKKIIENDRLGLVYGSQDLIRRDVENLLREFFALTSPVTISFFKNGDKIKIVIETECSSVKKFNTIGELL